MNRKCWRLGVVPLWWLAAAVTPVALATEAAATTAPKAALDCFNHGDYVCAQQILADAQKRQPQNAEIAYYLGRSAHRRHDWKTAVEQLQHAVDLQPRQAEYHFRLGLALSRFIDTVGVLSKPGIATRIRDALVQAIALNPDFIDARDALLKYDLAAPGFLGGSLEGAREQAAEIAKRSAGDGHIALAEIADDQKQAAVAVDEYKAAIAAGPAAVAHDARIALSQLYQRQRRYDDSIELMQQALRLDAQDRQAQYELGNTALLCGCRSELGIAAVKDYLAQPGRDDDDDPAPAQAHLLLGSLYRQQQKRAEARVEYSTALQLDAQLDEARQALRTLD